MEIRFATLILLVSLLLPLAGCEQPVPSLGFNVGDLFPATTDHYWRYNNDGRTDVSYWIAEGETTYEGEALTTFRLWVGSEQATIDDFGDDQNEWAVLVYFRRTAQGWYLAGWSANPDGASASIGSEYFAEGVPFALASVAIGQEFTSTAGGADWTTTFVDEENGPFEFNGQSYTDVWHIKLESSVGNFPFEGDYWLKAGPGIISYDVVGYRPTTNEPWNHIHNDVIANIFGID
ncbi:MAG: hypothetical protein KDA24_21880 [Deltaproteobacteria bacterium]|nr:hypothetical protein [Deltaproteobacteria bacterium]